MALSVPYSPINPRQRSGAGWGATVCLLVAVLRLDVDGDVDDCDLTGKHKPITVMDSTAIIFIGDVIARSNLISFFT